MVLFKKIVTGQRLSKILKNGHGEACRRQDRTINQSHLMMSHGFDSAALRSPCPFGLFFNLQKILLFLFFLFFTPSIHAESIPWDCSVSPKNFFVGEDKAVIFGCRFFSDFSGSKVVVAEKNEENKVKYFWELNDNAFFGDKKAGDGFWSRKVDFKERTEGKITFTFYFIPQDKEVTASFLDEAKPVFDDLITLSYRPSFIELLGQVWKKL